MKPFFRCAALLPATLLLSSCRLQTAQNTASSVTPAPVNAIDTIFVPGADDKLHPRKVSSLALDTQLKSGGNPAPALDEIVKSAPQWFPKGARVEDVKDNGAVITLLLSPQWNDAKHWSKGETITQLAVYAMVNTLAKDGKKVAFTIEGKPLQTIGELDASDPFEADPSLNAPSKASAKPGSQATAQPAT